MALGLQRSSSRLDWRALGPPSFPLYCECPGSLLVFGSTGDIVRITCLRIGSNNYLGLSKMRWQPASCRSLETSHVVSGTGTCVEC